MYKWRKRENPGKFWQILEKGATQKLDKKSKPNDKTNVFTGHYYVKIDQTLRITIPSKFIQVLEGRGKGMTKAVWILPGTTGLRVLPKTEWEVILGELNRISPLDRNGQDFKRFMLSRALECELDAQNRIRLTKQMMSIGNLNTNELAFTGAGNEMFVEDAAHWEQGNAADSLNAMWEKGDKVFSTLLNQGIKTN